MNRIFMDVFLFRLHDGFEVTGGVKVEAEAPQRDAFVMYPRSVVEIQQ